MAYKGTTSTAPNPPRVTSQGITGTKQWHWNTTHISSDVEEPNFITDGLALGMKVGDSLLHMGSTTYVITSHAVIAVGATTTQLSTGSTYAK